MKKRLLASLLLALALFSASCAGKPAENTDTTDTTVKDEQTTADEKTKLPEFNMKKRGTQKLSVKNYNNPDTNITATYQYESLKRYTDTSSILRFSLNGREAIIVIPHEPAEGNPTVWRAEYFEAFDVADKAMLERGWHIVYYRVTNMFGCDESLRLMRAFYSFAEDYFGLSDKPVLFGFSAGGLISVNYAAKYPDSVGALYLDAPVQDIRDWPCKNKDSREYRECMKVYALTEETLATFDQNPIDKTDKIAHIPTIIVAGLVDTVVNWEINGKVTAERMEAAGAIIEVITKPDCDHHPHSLDDPTPIVEFIEEYRIK